MNILVLNCGSSSLKYQLINMDDESVLAKGLVERIGIEGSILTHKPTGKDKYVVEQPMKDHNIAVKLVLDALVDETHGVIKNADEIAAVGHRVLHAGEKYKESCLVNEDVKSVVRECFDLGPLHNPANLIGIEAVEAAMPGKPNVAVWDTAFGGTMEPKAYLYAIPREYYEKYHVRITLDDLKAMTGEKSLSKFNSDFRVYLEIKMYSLDKGYAYKTKRNIYHVPAMEKECITISKDFLIYELDTAVKGFFIQLMLLSQFSGIALNRQNIVPALNMNRKTYDKYLNDLQIAELVTNGRVLTLHTDGILLENDFSMQKKQSPYRLLKYELLKIDMKSIKP